MKKESLAVSHLLEHAFERHSALVSGTSTIFGDIEKGAKLLVRVLRAHRKILVCGNGGSAADSQHFVAEWVCRYKNERSPLPAIALTTDTSVITAIGNDYSFEEIFSRQVRVLGVPGDVLVAFTTSGHSKNVLVAIHEAKVKKLKTIILTGMRGVSLRNSADVTIVIPSDETARIQEMHQLIYHAWCEYADACNVDK